MDTNIDNASDVRADIRLSDYTPKSELVVPETEITAPKFPVFDAHMHFGRMLLGESYADMYEIQETVDRLKSCGVEQVINLDCDYGIYTDKMLEKCAGFEDFFVQYGTVDVSRFEESDFEKTTYSTLKSHKERGIRGLKFWKNISLSIKGRDGKFLRIDDERLGVIWQVAAEFDMPITIHIADPVAFFRPIDNTNERIEELANNPDWSFHGGGRFTFDELMEQQEGLLERNPNTTFVIAHVGSYSENLGKVSDWLDRYPNMYVDIADRISELGRQPYATRKFMQKYYDRVIFGTDSSPLASVDRYMCHYRFMETFDEYFSYNPDAIIPPQGRWQIYGVGLDDKSLEHIYSKNIKRILKIDI